LSFVGKKGGAFEHERNAEFTGSLTVTRPVRHHT